MDFLLPDAALPVDPPQGSSNVLTEYTAIHTNTSSYTKGRKLRIAIVSGEKRHYRWNLRSDSEADGHRGRCRESYAQGEFSAEDNAIFSSLIASRCITGGWRHSLPCTTPSTSQRTRA